MVPVMSETDRVVEHERIGPCRSTQEEVPWPSIEPNFLAGNHSCGGDLNESSGTRLSAAGSPWWCGLTSSTARVTGHSHQVPMAVIEIFRTIFRSKQNWRR